MEYICQKHNLSMAKMKDVNTEALQNYLANQNAFI